MKQERLLSLDVMRTASILLVLCRHTVDPPASATLANVLHCGGWIGVDLFFVLSGFLVSGLLFQEHQRSGSLRWGRFLVRRGFKIYPAFYAMMAVAIAVAARRHDLQWKPALAELLFVQNYVHGMWLHTWSLAVEEHFYLLLPICLLVLLRFAKNPKDPFRKLPVVWLCLAAILLALRAANLRRPFDYWTHMFPTHLRIDSLMLGVVISYWLHYRPELFEKLQKKRALLICGGLLLLSPAFFFEVDVTPWIWIAGFLAIACASAMILVGMQGAVSRNPFTAALGYIGARSYSIYVWHLAVRYWVSDKIAQRLGGNFYLSSVLFFVLSIVCGIGMAALLEQPMLRLRERLFPSPDRGVHPATASVRPVIGAGASATVE